MVKFRQIWLIFWGLNPSHILLFFIILDKFFLCLKVIKEVIEAAHAIGLLVRVCVSDMGAANRDLWKHLGITSTRTALQTAIPHPCSPVHRLYFMADVPHLLKSIRNCLLTQSIILPDSVVANAHLESNDVALQPVKDLIAMQESMTLKMAHKLKDVHVNTGNFQIKVSLCCSGPQSFDCLCTEVLC